MRVNQLLIVCVLSILEGSLLSEYPILPSAPREDDPSQVEGFLRVCASKTNLLSVCTRTYVPILP